MDALHAYPIFLLYCVSLQSDLYWHLVARLSLHAMSCCTRPNYCSLALLHPDVLLFVAL